MLNQTTARPALILMTLRPPARRVQHHNGRPVIYIHARGGPALPQRGMHRRPAIGRHRKHATTVARAGRFVRLARWRLAHPVWAMRAVRPWAARQPAVQATRAWLARWRSWRVLAAVAVFTWRHRPRWATWLMGALAVIPGWLDELIVLPMLAAYVALRHRAEFAAAMRQAWAGVVVETAQAHA